MALRASWLFWLGLSVIAGGALLAALGASSALGIEFVALGYLLVLASMYRVGVRMYTRGGVITKQENIWAYRFSFLLLSFPGFEALCIALSKSVGSLRSCDTVWCKVELVTMGASGLIALLLIASFAVVAAISFFVWLIAAARSLGRSSKRSS